MSALTICPGPTPAVFVYTSNTAAILFGNRNAAKNPVREQPVNGGDVRAQLERVLASRTFERMPRISRFLAYVTEQTLACERTTPTEYDLAIHVFHRDRTFKPSTDAIVRVQARRLRKAVERYYEAEGQNDSVLIQIPKGSYVPSFTHRHRSLKTA